MNKAGWRKDDENELIQRCGSRSAKKILASEDMQLLLILLKIRKQFNILTKFPYPRS